ncbi:MAG: hypothetical protein ACT4PU_06720 [Planctomycetota bacterium]
MTARRVRRPPPDRYVVCLSNRGYAASLEVRKLYCCKADREAVKLGLVRVVDESGEPYLYPADFFAPVRLSADADRRLRRRRRG